MKKRDLQVLKLGTVSYREALNLQKDIHADIVAGRQKSTLLLLEHLPVITLGKHATMENVLVSEQDLKDAGIDLEQVDRGGEATAHEPGQLVVYPLLDLNEFHIGPKTFVKMLEETVLELLAAHSLLGHRDEKFPGVWVGNEKICSIGIRISRGVSYHGLALNVSNSLDTFKKIIPCGIKDRGLRSLSDLLGKEVSISETAECFLKIFYKKFEVATIFFKD